MQWVIRGLCLGLFWQDFVLVFLKDLATLGETSSRVLLHFWPSAISALLADIVQMFRKSGDQVCLNVSVQCCNTFIYSSWTWKFTESE